MLSLSLFAAGVIALFGAVIFFGLRLSAQARQRALEATPIDERRLLEEKIDVAGSRRMWRMVLLERMTEVKYAIQDEHRRVLAELSLGLGPGFSRVLRVGQKTLTVLIQSPRSAFAGKANGRASDSVVVRDEAALIFESLPWAEGTTRGTAAHTTSGVLEIVWAPVTLQLKKETCRVFLNGNQVGESLAAFSADHKHILALDPALAESLVPFIFTAIEAGLYQRSTTRSRAGAAHLEGLEPIALQQP